MRTNPKKQFLSNVIFAMMSAGGLAVVCYLCFVVPKMIEVWAEQGRALSLSFGQKTLVEACHFCLSRPAGLPFGLLFMALFVTGILVFGARAVIAAMGNRRNNPSQ